MSTFSVVYCVALATGVIGLLWIFRGFIVDRWNIPFLEKRWNYPEDTF